MYISYQEIYIFCAKISKVLRTNTFLAKKIGIYIKNKLPSPFLYSFILFEIGYNMLIYCLLVTFYRSLTKRSIENVVFKFLYYMIKYVFEAMRMNEINIEQMEYLFLRRKRSSAVSERQKNLLFKAAQRHWEEEFVGKEANIRKVDCRIYKAILYQLEIRQVFLDTSLSLKKLSELLETNQTYLSNVVNKYFGCNLKELVNSYRVEYAKELLDSGRCTLNDLPCSCGFASKSAFYSAFSRIVGISPLSYQSRERRKRYLQVIN